MARIFVMRGDDVIVVSRRRPLTPRLRPVERPWNALVEVQASPSGRLPGETALIFAPPVALGALAVTFAPPEISIAVGGASLILSTYLTPRLRRHLAGRRLGRRETIVLRGERARAAFDRTVEAADRLSETWPALGSLVDPDEASAQLAEALFQIATVLARRDELDAVLAATDPLAETSPETRSQLSAARAARARIEADFVRRETSLRRADQAGRDFIHEQQMRAAVAAADQTLRTTPVALPPAPPPLDPGADLADHTHAVLAAYRELTIAGE